MFRHVIAVTWAAFDDADDLQAAGAKEAIELYKGLLKKYPLFERNDQVLYQLSRAYEETGQIDIAMDTLDQLIREFPKAGDPMSGWVHISFDEENNRQQAFTIG